MNILKTILGFLVVLLIVIIGAGYYLTSGMQHGIMNMDNNAGKNTETQTNQPSPQAPAKGNQKVTVVLEPDLRNYIDDINKGISLINEANGLITMDPFFSNPPKVTKGKIQTTPFDKLLPKVRDNPIIIYPDGTYQSVLDTGKDQKNTFRGIYKLGQGMTVLNSVLDKMNDDISKNNFPIRNPNLYYQGTAGAINPNNYMMPGYSNMPGMYPNNMNAANAMPPNMSQSTMQGMTGMTDNMSIFNSSTITNILYIVIFIFGILAIIAVFGFLYNYVRGPKTEPEI